MVDSGYTGQNFANEISSLTSTKVIVVKEMSYTNFRLSPNGGSLNVHLVGWEIIIVYGVTVSVSSTLVMFTSNKKLMGEFANHTWVKYAAWFATISAGNLEHLLDSPDGWLAEITV